MRFETYSSSCTLQAAFRYFEEIPFNLIQDLDRTLQAAHICVISKLYLNSIKNTDFSVFLRYFEEIPVNLTRDSERTLQAALICIISEQYLNSIKNTDFSVFYRYFEKIPINPTSDSERASKVAYILKFLLRSDHFSIFTPNLAGPYL